MADQTTLWSDLPAWLRFWLALWTGVLVAHGAGPWLVLGFFALNDWLMKVGLS